jgi:opacity protein-like surface antigen
MKRWNQLVLVAAAAAALGLGAVSADAATPNMKRREAGQRARIEQGVHSGRLTRGEAFRLRQGERHLNRMDNRFGRDGTYGPRERMRMHGALDRQSARIWRLKHNRRERA